jgi:HlyD family secretion protein
MFNKLILPLIAISGFGFAVYTIYAREPIKVSEPLTPPPTQSKYRKFIAGAGIVEARLENIPVGAAVPGVVWEVFVKVKDRVKKGDPLFKIDDRDIRAELAVREANLASAIASHRRLEAAPQVGDIATAEAAVEEARARVNDTEAASARTERLYQRQMGTASDYDKDRFSFQAAKASLGKALADLNRIKVTWEADKQVSKAAVAMADSQLQSSKIQLDRMTVRALGDGEILQVNVRPGQYAVSMFNQALVVIGDSKRLHVRVDIDENDVPLFNPKSRAIATLKGRPSVAFEDLALFKVEPYIIPKKSLTGDNSERVDTRVLQVVYELPEDTKLPLYVGQQMDAYIEAVEPEGLSLDTDLRRLNPFDKKKDTEAPKGDNARQAPGPDAPAGSKPRG